MDQGPAYAEVRAMHAADLSRIKVALTQFLAGWAGGPRDWFEQNPDRCIMSVHKPYTITKEAAAQWADCMQCAITDVARSLPIWPKPWVRRSPIWPAAWDDNHENAVWRKASPSARAADEARFMERTCGRIGMRTRAWQASAIALGIPALSFPKSRTSSAMNSKS